MAAAMKRYLGCVADPRLAEMIFVASLYHAGTGARVSENILYERLADAFHGQLPPGWSDHLGGPDFLDVAMLTPRDDHVELVVRGRQWWVYAQVEG